MHSRPFEAYRDELLGRRFDHSRSDLPACRSVMGVVHFPRSRLYVAKELVLWISFSAPQLRSLTLEPFDQPGATPVAHHGQSVCCPCRSGFSLGVKHVRGGPDVLTHMEPVENSRGIREVQVVNFPAPVPTIRGEDLFPSLSIATAASQAIQRHPEFLRAFPAPQHAFVPPFPGILPIHASHTHLLPDQAIRSGFLRVWFHLVGAVHDPIATDVDSLRDHFWLWPDALVLWTFPPGPCVIPAFPVRCSADL